MYITQRSTTIHHQIIGYTRGGSEDGEIYGYFYYIILYYTECDIMSIYEQCDYIYGIKRISKIEKILR